MKVCKYCRKEKSTDEFGVLASAADGLNPTCKACRNEWHRQYRLRNGEKIRQRDRERWAQRRDATLQRKYGITLGMYEEMFEAQGGACAICLNNRPGKNGWGKYDNLHVDHDPETGVVRGLLCFNCNTGIGQLQHDVERLERAVGYLL